MNFEILVGAHVALFRRVLHELNQLMRQTVRWRNNGLGFCCSRLQSHHCNCDLGSMGARVACARPLLSVFGDFQTPAIYFDVPLLLFFILKFAENSGGVSGLSGDVFQHKFICLGKV
ncbi:hypothetical protein Fot_20323 [Forsythia ovata]|uniref:Uncharacterized protein n=1 Tax=Forsythia ovata TaxID=205694 RepID=A0ABD1VNJ9_9LAMI